MEYQKNKLKIAMLGHKRIPSREGGIEIVVEELSTRLVKMGYSVTCFNRSGHHISGKEYDDKNIAKMKEYKGIKLKRVFTINKKGIAAMTSSFFASIHAALGDFDVVHFHAEGPCVMLWLPKLFCKRCICTVHGLDHQRQKWNWLAKAYILLGEKAAVKFADEIIVLSKNVQEYFMQTYGRKTRYIPNGVNLPQIQEVRLIKECFGLEKNEYILFVGRIVPEKGIKYLIKAYRGLNTDKKLVIAGGSSDTEIFMDELKQISFGDNRIIFTGFVQGAILDELYSNAYVFVLPSDLEGMPLSLLEAMSYGTCCLVSDINECTHVVEDKAVIFNKSDIVDLRTKLQNLCDCEALQKYYQANSSKFICNKYSWDDVTKQTINLYEGSDREGFICK